MAGTRARITLAILVVVIAAVLCGCTTVKRYALNRAEDLMDIFTVELTAGPGVDAHVQVTNIFGTAAGCSHQYGLMMHGRYVGAGKRITGGTLITAATSAKGDRMISLRGPEGYQPRGGVWFLGVPAGYWRAGEGGEFHAYSIEGMGALDLAVGASVGFGVHVGVSLLEIVDFLGGFTTMDLAGDDVLPPETGKPRDDTSPAKPDQATEDAPAAKPAAGASG